MNNPSPVIAQCLKTREVARRLRMSKDTILALIKAGKLKAINTASPLAIKPRYVVPPEALAEFERSRTVTPPSKPEKRKKPPIPIKDYYPDD